MPYAGSTVIRWNPTNNPVACSGSGGSSGWSGAKSTSLYSSFPTGALFSTTTFTLSCSNSAGTSSEQVTVQVGQEQQQQTCQDPQALNYGGLLPCRYQQNNQVSVDIWADDDDVNFRDSTIVHWQANNANSCQASGGTGGWSGTRGPSGTFFTGDLTSTRTFSIVCSNNSSSDSDSVTINVDEDNGGNVSVDISADDTRIDEGDSTRVRWTSDNADFCEGEDGDNGWNGRDLGTDGSRDTGDLDRDTTFRITCFDNNGDEDSDSVTIRTDNGGGNVSVDLTADDTSIDSGDSTRIRWNSDNADSCEGEDGTSNWRNRDLDTDGSFNTGSLTRDTTFSIRCENDDDSDDDLVTIRVRDGDTDQDFGNAPTAITTSAINITSGNAQLSSLILNSSGISATAWFEWGATPGLGFSTQRDSVGTQASVVHPAVASGLSPRTVYYYRAVAENAYGRSNGAILSFITNEISQFIAAAPTVIRTTSLIGGSGAGELVKLSIDGGAEIITAGEQRYYQVTWENVSSQILRDVVLRVLLPKTMTYDGSNKGVFSSADNSLNLDVGTLRPGDTDDLFLVASANRSTESGEQIVVVANLVYTTPNDTQGDAVAYTTHRFTGAGSVLGAAALFGGDFLPSTFFGWLILLILLLILAALIRHLFKQSPESRVAQS
ncbi:MAG: hypothetical protein AAB500_01020 [Patescibacteria group bacterium]